MPVLATVETHWYGDEIEAAEQARVIEAVQETVEEAATIARDIHAWHNRSGAEEMSIEASEPWVVGDTVFAEFGAGQQPWGSETIEDEYGGAEFHLPAIYLEFGTRFMPARPFIRPAADAAFPHLADRLRA